MCAADNITVELFSRVVSSIVFEKLVDGIPCIWLMLWCLAQNTSFLQTNKNFATTFIDHSPILYFLIATYKDYDII